jgi:hypothetical protein
MSLCDGREALPDTLSGYVFSACRETDLTISFERTWQLVSTYLPDYLRWLSIVDGFEILLHSSIIILLGVQVVTKLAKDNVLLGRVQSCLLSQVDSQNIQVTLVEYVKFLRKRLLVVSEDLNVVSSERQKSSCILPFRQL